MLYLAEVHKKSRSGFMGSKTELKLLAQQLSEQNWNTLSGEEVVPVEFTNDYNSGVLVLVELDNNRQVNSIQDAAKQLVGLLKNFSRMREKFHTQEEEIEGWKQSLIYQSQELTRREVDMEVRAEELQQLEEESQKLEQQRQEFEASREQIIQLKEQVERDRQQLEEGWGRLQNAQQELEAQGGALNDEQVAQIDTLLHQLDPSSLDSDPLQQQFDGCLTSVDQQLSYLAQLWERMEQNRQKAQQLQQDIDEQGAQLKQDWKEWHQRQDDLTRAKFDIELQEQALALKSEVRQQVDARIQFHGAVSVKLGQVTSAVVGDHAVDLPALRNMPQEELESTVEQLQQELDKLSNFVNDQEEELTLQRQSIEQLEERINQASEYDRLTMSGDLEDEKQHCQLLDQALEGQRQTLQQRAEILQIHRDVLQQRQGSLSTSQDQQDVDKQIEQALELLESQQQEQTQLLNDLDAQIEQLQSAIATAQNAVETHAIEQDTRQLHLLKQDNDLQEQRATLATLTGEIQGLQELLHPLQEMLSESKEQFSILVEESRQHLQGTQAQQQQTLEQLKQIFRNLGKAPDATKIPEVALEVNGSLQ